MLDGWMAREREPDWGAGPRRKNPQRIAWREIKSALIYRLDQRAQRAGGRGLLVEKYAGATPPETDPVDFGAAVQAEAQRRGLARAQKVYLVMDGAVWLWDLADDRLATARKTLDFHHARDHLHYQAMAAAGAPRGSGAAESLGKQWQQRLRGGGQTWGRPGLTHLLRVCILVKNRADPLLWN
jgi:hypothetical protein